MKMGRSENWGKTYMSHKGEPKLSKKKRTNYQTRLKYSTTFSYMFLCIKKFRQVTNKISKSTFKYRIETIF